MPSDGGSGGRYGGDPGGGGFDNGGSTPSFGTQWGDDNFVGPPTEAQQKPLGDQFFQDNFNNYVGPAEGQTWTNPGEFVGPPMPGFSGLPTDFDFMGPTAPLGFQGYELPSQPAAPVDGGRDAGFWDSEFGKNLKKFGLFALQMHPATRGPMALYNAANAFNNGQYGQGLSSLIGGVTGNPLAGAAGGLVGDAIAGKPVSGNTMGQFTGGLGSMIGGQVAGAPGAFLGGQFGRNVGQNMANNAGQPGQGGSAIGQGDFARTNYTNPQQLPQQQRTAIPKSGEMSGTDAAINGLAALYMYNRQNGMDKEQAARQAQLMQQQQQMMQTYMEQAAGVAPEMREPDFGSVYAKMDEMYAPGGNIAKELRTVLERKDAASGRRSQYGPREVELLSRLAQMRSQYEPAYLNAAAQEANAANQMSMADANARRAALQAAMQGQSGNYNAQAQALAAQQARETARMNRDQQLMNTIYTVGSGSNWWGLGDMWNNGGS